MPFQIIRNDITKVKADAIVNTANPNVTIGDGVDRAIYKAAGTKELLAERKRIGYLAPGEVGITKAFNLDAQYVIHVSGPKWEGGNKDEDKVLRSCYDKALQLAFDKKCNSIAFPLLATGTYGFPKELGIQIAIDSFTTFLEEHEIEITLVVFGDESVKISGELVDEVASFIDEEYEGNVLEEEYICSAPRMESDVFALELRDVSSAEAKPVESLEDALKNIYTDSLEKHIRKIINKKGLKNSQVYTAANISKQYFSKLLKGKVKPSKEKMLALAVGLRLNMDEAVDFLKIGGYALSPISQTDIIVEYFIRHEDYSVIKINIVLFDYGLDSLSNE